MPCSKGMVRCKSDCLHRAFVFEYRAARQACVLEQEALTGGGEADLAILRENGWQPMTFKRWLRSHLFRSRPDPDTAAPASSDEAGAAAGW
jgi:hypothetical protein